jgi:hypothetical protein
MKLTPDNTVVVILKSFLPGHLALLLVLLATAAPPPPCPCRTKLFSKIARTSHSPDTHCRQNS